MRRYSGGFGNEMNLTGLIGISALAAWRSVSTGSLVPWPLHANRRDSFSRVKVVNEGRDNSAVTSEEKECS